MINILPTQTAKFRTFGWVQDPGDFRSLCDVVAIFDSSSAVHQQLVNDIIPRLVELQDGQARLTQALNKDPLRIIYKDLVGTSFVPRGSARCNGIVQATVPGQVREFISNWPADNFVRWAHALGFIKYHYEDDSFSITESGLKLTKARTAGKELNESEKKIIISALLAYPPAVRVLSLLAEEETSHLTKFEIGKQLGFVGEGGFTSLPQSILIRALAHEESKRTKNKMKTDWDGSADKYARMIATWLTKLDLVEQVPKEVTVTLSGKQYTEVIGQAYVITAAGFTALNRTKGHSRHRRIPKNVYFEMLATKGKDREFLRTRRALVLKAISDRNDGICVYEVRDYLRLAGIDTNIETIFDDVRGLINIGLNILIDEEDFYWCDSINDFTLPLPQNLTRSDLTELKEEVRENLTHLSHEYLALIDLAYDSSQNRLFEMKTMELLIDECEYQGTHLGGSRKPDGICYSTDLDDDYGIIIDTKAYSGGYNLPISQADEMERYLRENINRNPKVNPNKWWEAFPESINEFYFLFVSGHFKGNYRNRMQRITQSTGVPGASVDIKTLLISTNKYKAGEIGHTGFKDNLFNK